MKGEKCKVTEAQTNLHFSFFTSHFALNCDAHVDAAP
jgi:hypothetical protein